MYAMGKLTSGSVWLVCLGYCLVLACSGCARRNPRHGLILRGDCSLEINRIPWVKSRTTAYQGCSESGAGCAGECRSETGPAPEPFPGEALPEPPERNPSGSAEMSDVSAALLPGALYQFCRGRLPLPGGIAVSRDPPPRFHPVPVQPVFSSGVTQAVHVEAGVTPGEQGNVPPTPPEEAVPRIEIVVPAPAPESIPRPQAEPKRGDRVTRRIETAPRPGSWLFNTAPEK